MNHRKSLPLLAAVLTATALAATVAAAPAGAASARSAATPISCSSTLRIGMLAPLTGVAGYLGQEQLSWAKEAVKLVAPADGLKIKLVLGDAPVEQGPSAAQTVAQKFVADKGMVGILGGSTSGSVIATSKTFTQAGLVQVSESATNASLTKGDNQGATKAFYRVVPADDFQGATDANYMLNTLHVKKVVLVDFQEPYSLGLVGQVQKTLGAAGVSISHESIANTVTDYSSYVTNVPSDADIVFFPTQSPAAAQAFAAQLAEQGKKAKVFGGDGSNGLGVFEAAGSYISSFAPTINNIAADASIIKAWKKDNPGKPVGSFGPAAYGAVQVLLKGIQNACAKGHGTLKSRAAVIPAVGKVKLSSWILGGPYSWSKVNVRDPSVTKFYIYQIQSDGSYKTVN
jgi:branched-chain amino acid transport system substrate-binding protein